ncbi:MAG: DUF6712 family protein [Bacteroidales bacterium]
MLFNKNLDGQKELKSLLGFVYVSNKFENIETDIMLAEEDLANDIGRTVMTAAENHYKSVNFGTGGAHQLMDDLVRHIQLPIAYYACANFAVHTDVSHGEDGRKVVIDPANQKMAWEWMIDKDDEAIINKAHKTTDRLLAFLESNAESIEAWKNSDERKAAKRLFIPSAKIFNDIFPIDNSRRFFMKIVPFILEAERKHIIPVLTRQRYDDMKTAMEEGSFTDPDGVLQLIRVPLAFFALSMAVKRLSIRILPNGIFQDYLSDTQTRKASQVADADTRNAVGQMLYQDASFELQNLQKELEKIEKEATNETYVPESLASRIDPDAKILRL